MDLQRRSTTLSRVWNISFLNPTFLISFQICSMGFISGVYGGMKTILIFSGTIREFALCQAAPSHTKPFAGEPAPFVMELPAYHLPTIGNVLRSMWERGWSFIKKAGTIILLSTIVLWFLSRFGWVDGAFGMLAEDEIGNSILAAIGNGIAWIFAPLSWGN